MSVVLVLEPDRAQSEQLLRVLRKRVRAEAVLVTSTAAAIEVIANATPDLILVSALLSPRDEDRLMAHLRSLEGAPHLQTLTIPQLAAPGAAGFGAAERNALGRFRKKKPAAPTRAAGCDPDVFAAEITAQLARAYEIRSQPVVRKVRRAPVPAPEPEIVSAPPDFTSVLFDDSGGVRLQPDRDDDPGGVRLQPDRDDDPGGVPLQPDPVSQPVDDADDQLQRLARRFGFGSEMFKVADVDAPPALAAYARASTPEKPDTIDDAIQIQLAAERLAEERIAAERLAAERLAEERIAAERLAAERLAEERLAEERLAAQRLAEERIAAERLAAERQAEARIAADRLAAQQLADERLAEERLAAQQLADERLQAERRAADAAAVEAEKRLAAELERVRAEGEARRLAELARLQAEAELVRDAAIAEAKATAEREAREALASELTRARSEAEGVFAADLARVRAEVEGKLSAQVEAAETRLAQAERARSAAEAAAADALGAEVARVRGEAETRLQAELERIRTEAEAARMAEQSHAKHATRQIREAAAREAAEARAGAEAAARQTLEAEMARVRAQADTFLQTEVARVHAEAQERQAAELLELRAQMAEIRDTAARTAAEQSADYYKMWQPAPEPSDNTQPAREEHEALEDIAPELLGRHFPWIKWAVPTAACMLFIANIGSSAKPSPPPAHVVEPVEKPFVQAKTTGSLKVVSTPAGARLLVDGRSYGETPMTIPDLQPGPHTLVLRTSAGGTITRRVTIRTGQTAVASEAIFSGWLALYSTIPMSVSLNGKPEAPASDGRIMMPPGSYEVTLVNERFNYHGTRTLSVRPGEVTAYTVALPSAAVHISAPEGADISVDGKPAGKAPLADASLPLGTHEITATLPDGGQRTATIAVRYGEITEARLE